MSDDYKLWELKQSADFAEKHNFMIEQYPKLKKKLEAQANIKQSSTANVEDNPKGNNERISTREEGKHRFDKAIYDFDNYDTPIMPVQNQEVHLKPLLDWISKGLNKRLNHFNIAELWATVKGNSYANKGRSEIIAEYQKLIGDAVINEDLRAKTTINDEKGLGGIRVIESDSPVLNEIRDGWLRENGKGKYVQYTIHRDDFKSWLESTNRYPLDNGCLLNEWFLGIKQENKSIEQPSTANIGNTKGNNGQGSTPKVKEHEKRNNDYIAYLKETIPHINDKPEPHTFNFRREYLQAELKKRDSQLWQFNFEEWNKQRPYKDIVKLKRGRS